VKGKNVRMLAGIPLLAHSIRHAKDSGLFEAVAVSSDSAAILEIGAKFEADHLVQRPDELATDDAAKLPVIRHCVSEVQRRGGRIFDTLVDLDATSPLRVPEDIREAVSLLESNHIGNVITGMPARRSPYFNLVELTDRGVVELAKRPRSPILRRQDAPRCFDMNASIYVWTQERLFSSDTLFNHDTRLHVMPEDRSIDIDSEFDFKFVEFLLNQRTAGNES
jgi:N-acylneuraminate cytidylyltransferase/CMP-N,N'-diacetyllegionaminic acid synthase